MSERYYLKSETKGICTIKIQSHMRISKGAIKVVPYPLDNRRLFYLQYKLIKDPGAATRFLREKDGLRQNLYSVGSDRIKHEGYWYNDDYPQGPIEIDLESGLNQCDAPQQVLDWLGTAKRIMCLGSSICRICGQNNGCYEITELPGWGIPEGLLHYYTVHKVRPSLEFLNALYAHLRTSDIITLPSP
jgi:hypothetical protein